MRTCRNTAVVAAAAAGADLIVLVTVEAVAAASHVDTPDPVRSWLLTGLVATGIAALLLCAIDQLQCLRSEVRTVAIREQARADYQRTDRAARGNITNLYEE